MSEEPAPADLTFIGTEDLIAELMGRCVAVVIVREMKAPKGDGQRDVYYDYDGGVSMCIGLADRARYRLLRLAEEGDMEPDGD